MNSSNADAPTALNPDDRRNTLVGIGRVSDRRATVSEVPDESGVRRMPRVPADTWFVRDGGWRM